MKKITAISLILALALSLTGCVGEIKLYNAMEKMQEVRSIESEMKMDFSFETEGFSEEEQLIFEEVSKLINDMKIKIYSKQIQNEDQTMAKAEMDLGLKLPDMDMDMTLWVDADLSQGEPEMLQVIKLPKLLMSQVYPDKEDIEYIVYDVAKTMDQEEMGMDFDKIMEWSKEVQPKIMEFIKGFYKDSDSKLDFVTRKEKRVVGNQYLEIYELKLNDARLKELVKYGVNYSLDQDGIMDFMKEYMEMVMSATVMPEEEKQVMEDEIDQMLEEMDSQLPEFKAMFNDFMEDYKDIDILGKEGIVIEYGIDKHGYLVHEEGSMNFRLDIGQIAETMGIEFSGGIIKMGVNYTSRNYNINDESIVVEMPKTDEENSVDYIELLEEQTRKLEKQMKEYEEEMKQYEEEMEAYEDEVKELEELENREVLPQVE